MEYGYLAGVNYESACDGDGVRAAIFLSGCAHDCPGCHNPETHDPHFGIPITNEIIHRLAIEIDQRPYLSGITLTGGDPLFEPFKTLAFLTALIRELGRLPNIWLYTGYVFDDIMSAEAPPGTEAWARKLIVDLCDVVVDGPFIRELADKRLAFRGSSNQNIIHVKDTYHVIRGKRSKIIYILEDE